MAKSDNNLLTQADYARWRKSQGLPGGTREAVRKAVEEGRISAFGPDKLIDKELADLQWERNTRARISPTAVAAPGTQVPAGSAADLEPTTDGVGPGAGDKPTTDQRYLPYRILREKSEAEMAAMESGKMSGIFTERERVDLGFFVTLREARDHLSSCARRVAAEVASLNTAEACESVIDREHRIVLEMMVATLKEHLGAPPVRTDS